MNTKDEQALDEDTQKIYDHYAQVASTVSKSNVAQGKTECCCSAGPGEAFAIYSDEILSRLPKGAKLASRGCGDPVAKANLKTGEVVCDLGSGGGIDAIIAGAIVGDKGHVFGVDMTAEMIGLARENATESELDNISFLQGQIENVPLPDESCDVVISNCVINLSTDKAAVLREACRILRPGGRLIVSDIIAFEKLNPKSEPTLRKMTGCLNGMLEVEPYKQMIYAAGFSSVEIEAKTIYTLEIFEERLKARGRQALFEEAKSLPDINATCGSAIVRAWKD